ncbi:MAG: hypothetical protein SNG27_00215 [Rikenellaceae bacterium]
MATSSRSNVGGVFSVVMWLGGDSGRSDPPTSLDSGVMAVRVPLISEMSSYSESVEIDGGVRRVEQTLNIVTHAQDDFWRRAELFGAERTGCIAEVEVSSLGRILLGWSSRLGYDQPLRLVQTSTQSSSSVAQGCTKKWVFKAYSTQSLI